MKTRKPSHWRIDLGVEHWKRLTHAGWTDQGLRLLGRISREGQFGALAVTPEGTYLQINGDHVTPVNRSQVEYALRVAAKTRAHSDPPNCQSQDRPAPVVSFRRRRRVPTPES
jgi:hypothetical protein